MKKVLFSMMMLAALSASAYHPKSDLKLTVSGQTWFSVSVDHGFLGRPDRQVMVTALEPGTHYLEVIGYGSHPHGPFGPGQRLFDGYVHVPAASLVIGHIDRWSGFHVSQILPKAAPVIVHYAPPGLHFMDDFQFRQLVRTIESQHFDSSRLLVARQGLSTGYVSTAQVRRMMELMTFESTRLKLAKYAYNRVVDPERYFLVNDAFTFSSSIRALDKYIRYHS